MLRFAAQQCLFEKTFDIATASEVRVTVDIHSRSRRHALLAQQKAN